MTWLGKDLGYPANWQSEVPGPYPLGMPIWRDSWGDTPALVLYGNGTDTPGPALPVYYIAATTTAYNAGLGPPLEPIPLEALKSPATKLTEATDMLPNFSPVSFAQPLFNRMGIIRAGTGYANPTGFPGEAVNNAGMSVGTIAQGLGAAGACEALPPAYQLACRAALAIVGGATAGSAGDAMAAGRAAMTNQPLVGTNCPAGWIMVAGRCTNPAAVLPGGQPMTLTRNEPTTGSMGLTALTPTQVGTISRKDGSTGPILKCPARYVLGMDFLCYPKQLIPNNLRAHPRGTRPLLTGGDVRILRRAKSLEKKVKKLGTKYGTKTCHCSSPTRRKK